MKVTLASLVAVTLLTKLGVVSAQPSIEASASGFTLRIPENAKVAVQYYSTDGQNTGNLTELATQADLDALVDTVRALEERALTKATAESTYQSQVAAAALYAPVASITQIEGQIEQILADLVKVASDVGIKSCEEFDAPDNGEVTHPLESIPGTLVTFTCKIGFVPLGDTSATCLTSGKWSVTTAPTCVVIGSQKEAPAKTCKHAYSVLTAGGAATPDGEYWIRPDPKAAAFGVYCDMTTKTKDGMSGWTLCGKYDRNRAGPRYLAQGFGRSVSGGASMTSISDFSSAGDKRWASIDCRPIVQMGLASEEGSEYMMHVGTDSATEYGVVQFTNVMLDAREDATQLFDVGSDDKGQCTFRDPGSSGDFLDRGITTWDTEWNIYDINRVPNGELGVTTGMRDNDKGACLVGDGHHFCSGNRAGSRLSNAGSGTTCGASQTDTIYWAWVDDDHLCCLADYKVPLIGTGCKGLQQNGGPGTSQFRFNLLFLY